MGQDQKDNHYLGGQLLLSMPQMSDPRFHRSVIFVCAHDPQGAMGLVINSKVPALNLKTLLTQFDIEMDSGIVADLEKQPVITGGPVETVRGFLLHSPDFENTDTVKPNADFHVTGTVSALNALARGKGPKEYLFALGYAGWDAGQLEREIHDNAWLTTPATPELVFHTPRDVMWEKAMNSAGIDPFMLSSHAGQA